jgi:tetratricopeptide (TPR) repeat protein
LSKKACERLIQQVLGKKVAPESVAYAVEQSAGNALFLEELIRSIAEGESQSGQAAPETVVAMLQARIGRFEAGARRAVRAASVFGQTFWRGGVAVVLGLPKGAVQIDDWLSSLVSAEVIEPRSDSHLAHEQEYGFRHALVRDAAYSLLTESDLVTGHKLVAEFLEETGEHDAAVIAGHYERGGEFDRAATLHQKAGDDAARLGLYSAARRHNETSVAVLERLPPSAAVNRRRAEALIKLTSVTLSTDTPELHFERLATAESLAAANLAASPEEPETADKLLLTRVHYFIGRVNYYAGRYPDAIRWYQRVLPMTHELEDPELRAMPAVVIGMAKAAQGDARTGGALLSRALEPLRETDNEFEFARAQMYMGWIRVQRGEYHDGMHLLDEWISRARSMKHTPLICIGELLRAFCHRVSMNWQSIVQEIPAVGVATAQHGLKILELMARGVEAWAQAYCGHYELATEIRRKAIVLGAELGGRYISSDWWAAGDAEIALVSNNSGVALQAAREAVEISKPANLLLSWGIAERVWAVALSRLGWTLKEAEEHLRESLRVLVLGDLLLESAQTELWWGRMLRERDDIAGAQPHFDKALAIFESAGCDKAVAQVRRSA